MLVHDAAESQQHQPVHSDESPALVGGQGLVVSWSGFLYLFSVKTVYFFLQAVVGSSPKSSLPKELRRVRNCGEYR